MSNYQSNRGDYKPYLFILKEGKSIDKNFMDYSLMLMQIEPLTILNTSKSAPIYLKAYGTTLSKTNMDPAPSPFNSPSLISGFIDE